MPFTVLPARSVWEKAAVIVATAFRCADTEASSFVWAKAGAAIAAAAHAARIRKDIRYSTKGRHKCIPPVEPQLNLDGVPFGVD